MNTQQQKQRQVSIHATSLKLLAMMAERYLTLEDSSSEKMALEITAGWDCKTIV